MAGQVAYRHCIACGHKGEMKTWMGNYNGAQLIMILLLICYVVPGIIFIAWAWGKFKCPNCGALGKNVSWVHHTPDVMEKSNDTRICPMCAETIKADAIKCKHCGSMIGSEDKKGTV